MADEPISDDKEKRADNKPTDSVASSVAPPAGTADRTDEKEELTPEKKLITQREAGEITPQEFLDLLEPDSDLRLYWNVFFGLLTKKKIFRNQDLLPLAARLGIDTEGKKREVILNATRGVADLFVNWEVMSSFEVESRNPKTKTVTKHTVYLCNLPGFYAPDELIKLIPEKDTRLVMEIFGNEKWKLDHLAPKCRKIIGESLLETLLEYYVAHELVNKTGEGAKMAYKISHWGKLQDAGLDPELFDLLRMENELILRRKEDAARQEFTDFSQVVEAQDEILQDFKVEPFQIEDLEKEESIRMLFLCEPLFGYTLTAAPFINSMMKQFETKKDKPHITVATGFIIGNFIASQILRGLTLNTKKFLNHIYAQFQAANLVLDWAEKTSQNLVCYVLGDDDKRTGHDYALIARAAEKQGPPVGGFDLSPEASRWLKDQRWLNKCLIQWLIVWPYQYRIGRTLKNKGEIQEHAESLGIQNINKSEYYMIVHIHWAKEFGKPFPEEYAKLINLEALFGEKEKARTKTNPKV